MPWRRKHTKEAWFLVACLLVGMAVGLLLSQGGNDGLRENAPLVQDSIRGNVVGPSDSDRLSERFGGDPIVVLVPSPTPVPLPPAEALPYVSKEFDLCTYAWECEIAARVQRCENRAADPWRISITGDYGIMQINRFTWEWWLNQRGFNFETEWMIPERNVAMAFAIWEDHGWWEWSCF